MTLNIYNTFARWFTNKSSGTEMTWWKTNFNMPVPDIFDDNTNYTKTDWMLNPQSPWTSFDLSWFNYWWEVIAANTVFTVDWPYSNWIIDISQKWKKPDWSEIFTNWPYTFDPWSVCDWCWQSYQIVSNQWVAPWEIDIDWTYTLEAIATWWINQTSTFNVTFTNVPVFPWYEVSWYLWVEWSQLCYTSANWFVHKIDWIWWTNVWTENSWKIWVEWIYLHWISDTWYKKTTSWTIDQFDSSFSNWATWSVSWQTPWYLYADNEFGYTHLSYIDANWDKRLIWDGVYPY